MDRPLWSLLEGLTMGYDSLIKRIAGRRVVFDQCVDAKYVMVEKLRARGVECVMIDDLLPEYTTVNGNSAPD